MPSGLAQVAGTRAITLRITLLAGALGAAVYASALPLYMYFRVSRPALALGGTIQGIAEVGDDLAQRKLALDQALAMTRRLARRASAPADSLRGAYRLVQLARAPLAQAPQAPLAPVVRAALAQTDSAMSRVANAVADVVALLGAGRWAEAATRLTAVDELARAADPPHDRASQLARADLVARERAVREAANEVRRDTLIWLLGGALLVPALVAVMRRRVWHPLRDLETGLAQVADGDLSVRVPVRGADELGQLAEHFNAMTRVLRDRAQEQGRFAAAGELLAGVAHEVNNPLMAIAAHAENRLADTSLGEEQRAEMTQILRQARRAGKLLRGLLRFVHATEPEVTRVNLNDVVRGALDLVSYRFGVDEITVGGRLDPRLPAVEGDAIKLEQVVVNLLANAIDALRRVTPPRQLTVDTWVQDTRVSVAIGDNGKGVPPEFVPRLFRPFATTKGRHGTGLGLYISRQIAREAGGDLVLWAAPAAGARFVLSLPAAFTPTTPLPGSWPAMPAPAAPPATPAASRGPGAAPDPRAAALAGIRVLIVDDEEGVRKPMARFLKRRGAEVEEAVDGVDALARLRARSADVILVDLRMPRMSGTELFARLEEERPELAARVLFLSGDVSQLAAPGNTPVARERVLVKPVELAELERRILTFARETRAPTP
jgi:C4-dicarboxylate-specific signal transduction histidine kinase/ActR/RegA family two-component response regulator